MDYMNFYFKETAEPQTSYSGSEEAEDTDPVSGKVRGDVNADGKFDVADAVMMKKWFLGSGDMTDRNAGDLNQDNVINVLDLCLMKNMLINP